jgi:hypothetical protein
MHLYHYSCLLRSRAVRDNGHAYAQDATVLSAVEHFVTLLPFGRVLSIARAKGDPSRRAHMMIPRVPSRNWLVGRS